MHLIGFLLRATLPEWKSALKRHRYYFFQYIQGSVFRKCAEIHCSRWRSSSTVGDASRNKEDSASKRNFTLVFIASCGQNGNFQRSQSFQSNRPLTFNRTLYRATTEWILYQEQAAEMGYLQSVYGVTLRDKVHRSEIHETRNVKPLLPI